MTLRAIDVCAGAGGWAVAARGLPIEIVAAFDRERDALDTYGLNHPRVECIECDVLAQDFCRWKGIDLILGGIPCEQVSPYRNCSKASQEELAYIGKLARRFLALPLELAARYWCFEDVVGLEMHLPILTPFMIVRAENFSAQRRNRLYIGNCPLPESPGNTEVLADKLRPGPYRIGPRLRGRKPATSTTFTPTTFAAWRPNRKAPTVTALGSRRDSEAAVQSGRHWRNLEWQELAALQGFPDDYVFIGNPGRVVKMIGQAVQIDTARAILKALCAADAATLNPQSPIANRQSP